MSDVIVTGEVRLSYVNVFQPKAPQNSQGEPKYSVTVLVPKTDVSTKQAIDAAIQQAINEAREKGIQLPPMPAIPIHDGDGKKQSGEEYGAECKGHWVFTASSKNKPEVVDANLQPIISPTAIYSGCYGRVSLRFYPYNSAGRKGIGCGLGNVQKLRDGELLGGGTTAKEDFGRFAAPAAPVYPQQNPYPQPTYQQQNQPVAPHKNGYGFLGM